MIKRLALYLTASLSGCFEREERLSAFLGSVGTGGFSASEGTARGATSGSSESASAMPCTPIACAIRLQVRSKLRLFSRGRN